MVADKQTILKSIITKKILKGKELKSCIFSFTILSCSAFNPAFVANVSIFLFKSELCINQEISDLINSSLFLIFCIKCIFCN